MLPWSLLAEYIFSIFEVYSYGYIRKAVDVIGSIYLYISIYTYRKRDIWPTYVKENTRIWSPDLKENARFVAENFTNRELSRESRFVAANAI